MLVVEHALFGATRAFAFLATDLFDAGAFGIDVALLERFDLVEEESAGEEPIESLLTRGLAFNLKMRRTVEQHHACRGLVDVLAAVTARADKRLVEVGFADAERGHALGELGFFLRTDRERAHGEQRSRCLLREQAGSRATAKSRIYLTVRVWSGLVRALEKQRGWRPVRVLSYVCLQSDQTQ